MLDLVPYRASQEVRRMTELTEDLQTDKEKKVAWELPKVGDCVAVMTEDYHFVLALVTTVHGSGFGGDGTPENPGYAPSINCVYVSPDQSKHDPYGTQLERYSSLQHYNGTVNMPRRGRCWLNYP
jgi:hypothetical protein